MEKITLENGAERISENEALAFPENAGATIGRPQKRAETRAKYETADAVGENEAEVAVEENEAEAGGCPDDLGLYAKEFASVAAGQLYLQLQKGDMRAIKLYYDLEEQKRRVQKEEEDADGMHNMARIGAVRRAVFGDEAMEEDRRASALAKDTGGV